MPYIIYLDETGDHSLELIDKHFPIFALTMFICEEDFYVNILIPRIYRLKMKYFGYEGVILHSRDIRKAQKEFGFLTTERMRVEFTEEIGQIMSSLDYQLIVSVIKKQNHKEKYGIHASSPYDLAMMFCLERLLAFLEEKGQKQVHLVAESRGKREDDDLRLSFWNTVNRGTIYATAERFQKINFQLHFVSKLGNVVGTQLADLAAYPIARHTLNPKQKNLAYNVVAQKIYSNKGGVRGLKVFP